MMIPSGIKPNTIHDATRYLNDQGKLTGVITQNIDGLYRKAGISTSKLVEVHGNGNRWICLKCKAEVNLEDMRYNTKSGNYLSPCHDFIVRPDIVLYDEPFKQEDIVRMDEIYANANVLIVMGTSLDIVYHYQQVIDFRGKIALINNQFIALKEREWDVCYIGSIKDAFH